MICLNLSSEYKIAPNFECERRLSALLKASGQRRHKPEHKETT